MRVYITLTDVGTERKQQQSLRLEPSVWAALRRIAAEHRERYGISVSAADAVTMLVKEWERRREEEASGADPG